MTSVKNQISPIEDSVTKELFVSCRHAHASYQRKLKSPVHDTRTTYKETKESSQKEKRKKEVHGEHHSSRKNKERLGKMVQELFKEADALATTEWIC